MKAAFEPPKLSLWPFFVADLALLTAAYWIGNSAGPGPSGTAIWAVVVCVGLGGLLACVPLVLNYTRKLDLALAERQKEIAALAETTASSAEQIGIAVAGLGQLSESLQRATKLAEHLPLRLQERVNELKAQLNEVAVNENEALAQELNALRTSETERLEAAVDRIHKGVTELIQAEAAASRHTSEALLAVGREAVEPVKAALADLERWEERVRTLITTQPLPAPAPAASPAPVDVSRVEAIPAAPVSVPPAAPAYVPAAEAPALPEASGTEPPAALTASSMPFEVVSAPKRSPRRSSHDLLQGDLGLDVPSSDDDFEPRSVASLSADGATRVIATAYIGIGNKLFIRGDGPGLFPDKGVPMQFISIGKWRWETEEADASVTVSFWKNDSEPASNLAEVTIDPSHQQEVKLTF